MLSARNRSVSGERNTRGRYQNDADPRGVATFRLFISASRLAHPPGAGKRSVGPWRFDGQMS